MNKLVRTGFFLGLSILLGLISSCDYTPTETNFKEIAPPTSNIEITVLDTNTVNQLRGRVTIPVQTKLNGHTVKYVLGYIDNREVSIYMSDPSHIVFNTEYYPDGNYTFTIILIASSNSGSLADLVGAEVLYSAVDYHITIFNEPVNTPQLKDISIENGTLKITWEKYNQYCFKQYILKRNGSIVVSFSDVNQTSYFDTTYFADNARYTLTTKVLNFSSESQTKYFPGITPTFVSATKTQDEKMLITWNKYPFTYSFGKYVVGGLEDSIAFTSVNDTTVIDNNPPLGTGGTYTLSVYSETGEKAPTTAYIHGEPIGTHLGSDEPRQLKYIPEKDLLINISYSHETYNYTMSYYDGSSMNLLKSKVMDNDFYESTLGISDNGDYIYYPAGNKVYKLNSTTLLKEDEIDLFSLMPIGNYNYIQTVKVNNSNQLVAIIVDNNNKWRPSFFNMNTKKLVKTFKLNMGGLTDLKISEDQRYLIFLYRLFNYDGNNLTEVATFSNDYVEFGKDYTSIIVWLPSKIQILNPDNLQTLQEIPGVFYFPPCIDSKTGLIGVDGNIYDANSGIKRGGIRVWGLKQFYLNGLYFVNGFYRYVPLSK